MYQCLLYTAAPHFVGALEQHLRKENSYRKGLYLLHQTRKGQYHLLPHQLLLPIGWGGEGDPRVAWALPPAPVLGSRNEDTQRSVGCMGLDRAHRCTQRSLRLREQPNRDLGKTSPSPSPPVAHPRLSPSGVSAERR